MMQWLTALSVHYPHRWILGTLGVTVLLLLGMPRLELRTDGSALHPPDSETVRFSETDRQIFHDPEQVIVVVTSRAGETLVQSSLGFSFLKDLDEAVRELPEVRASGVRSLAGLIDLQLTPQAITTDSYLDTIPEDPQELSALVERIRQHPLADGLLLGSDGKSAAVYVPRVVDVDRREFLNTMEEFLSEWREGPFDLLLTGPQVAETLLGDMVLLDLSRLIPIMVGLIFLLLWITLRTLGGLLIPFLEVMLVLIWTFGAMAWVGVPLTLVTTLMPVLLMSIAITDEIHLLERFQHKLQAHREASPGDDGKKTALLEALRELDKPIIATSVSTSIGLSAFLLASIVPLQHFGLFAAFGVMLAMVLTFTTIPAVIVLLPTRWFLPRSKAATRHSLLAHEDLAVQLGRRGLLIGALAVALALPGTYLLRVEDNWISNFDPESEIVTAERQFNQSFWGTHRFDVVWHGPEGFFFGPEGVALVDRFSRDAGRLPGVEGITSYLVPLGLVASAAEQDGPLGTLSGSRLDDFLALAMMSEDPFGILNFVTFDGSSARIRLFLKSEDFQRDRNLETALAGMVSETGVDAHFSGDIPLGLEMIDTIVGSQLRSIALTFFVLVVLVIAVYRWSRAALAVLLPVVAATLMVFGFMGYVGLPLGVATSMFASLVLGVGVDFGFHFVHGYRHQVDRLGDPGRAFVATQASIGKAIRWNVTVLALGFLVLAFSALGPNQSLGLLLALALVGSYLMTLLLLPGLLAPATEAHSHNALAGRWAEWGGK